MSMMFVVSEAGFPSKANSCLFLISFRLFFFSYFAHAAFCAACSATTSLS